MGIYLLAFLFVFLIFCSLTLLMAAILFPGDVGRFESIWLAYTEMPGPVGTFIRVSWPLLAIWACALPFLTGESAKEKAEQKAFRDRCQATLERANYLRVVNADKIKAVNANIKRTERWLRNAPSDPSETEEKEIRRQKFALLEYKSERYHLEYVDEKSDDNC